MSTNEISVEHSPISEDVDLEGVFLCLVWFAWRRRKGAEYICTRHSQELGHEQGSFFHNMILAHDLPRDLSSDSYLVPLVRGPCHPY